MPGAVRVDLSHRTAAATSRASSRDARRRSFAADVLDLDLAGAPRERAVHAEGGRGTNSTIRSAKDRLQLVVVTDGAARFRDAILGADPTPIWYRTPPAHAILAEDVVIERLRLDLAPDAVTVRPVGPVFAGR